MKNYRVAFTLLEVLISVMLLSLIMVGLNETIDKLRLSNKHISKRIAKVLSEEKVVKLIYQDILQSDGTIDIISKDKNIHRLIINNTQNSLYGLFNVKVAWIVDKNKNSLLRDENGDFSLPLKHEENIAIDKVIDDIEIFTCYKNKDKNKILLILRVLHGNPEVLLIHNIQSSKKNNKSKSALRI